MANVRQLADLVLLMKNGTTAMQNQDGRGLPVTRIETISDGSIDPQRVRYVELDDSDVERWKVQQGDILLSHINSVDHIGKSAIYVGSPETLIHGMNLLLLRPDNRSVLPEYLHFGLRSRHVREHIRARCKRAINQASINQKELGAIELPVPSITEQRRIVDIFSRAEGIVRLRREAEKKAAELIPTLFLDMFGDPATNPKGWPKETVGEVIESADYGSSTKASDDGSGLPLIRMSNVDYAGTLNLTDLKFVNLSDTEVEKYRLREGDIIFNRTNSKELVGKTGMWGNDCEAVVASYFIRLRVDRNRLHPCYLWAFMNSRHMKRVLFDTARGAIGQANINSKELKAFPVAVPPLTLQQNYATRLEDIRSIQSQQAAAKVKAQATFDALLTQIFSTVTT